MLYALPQNQAGLLVEGAGGCGNCEGGNGTKAYTESGMGPCSPDAAASLKVACGSASIGPALGEEAWPSPVMERRCVHALHTVGAQ